MLTPSANGLGGKDLAPIRSALKSIAVSALAVVGWVRIRFSASPTLVILTYHRVLPPDHPDRKREQPGMVISPEMLHNHIRLLKKLGAMPIHLSDWLDARQPPAQLPRLSFALTFDDGWRDNFEYAYPILKEEQVPATIFLVTRLLDTNRTFWPEQILQLLTSKAIVTPAKELEWLLPYLPEGKFPSAPLNLEEADEAINRLKAKDDATIIEHLANIDVSPDDTSSATPPRAILNTDELKEMAGSGLIRFGTHTQHHYRLNRLETPSDLEREIVNCLEDLQYLGDAVTPIFCYPNGDITRAGEELVGKHYQAACTTSTGWNTVNTDPLILRRFTIHDGNSFSDRRLMALLGRGGL